MNPWQILAAQPAVPRLGSTLLHFLWQGVALAALYGVARRAAAKAGPNVRYAMGCLALAAMAAAPLVTWRVLSPAPAAAVPSAAAASAAASGATRGLPSVFLEGASVTASAPLFPWVVAIWLAGAAIFWARLVAGWLVVSRLRSRSVFPAPAPWQLTLHRLKTRMRVSSPVRLLLSARVPVPAVVGWLRPVLLVPVGALAGLPAEQVEALLLHELAHIRRHDYLVNMLQSAVEALLFYHPAVWWVSGHMRAERELCCDDAVVSVSGDAVLYARALAGLSALCPPLVMAASGGSLAYRIARLLGRRRPAPRTVSGPGIAVAAVLPVLAAVALFAQPAARPTFEVASIKPASRQGPRMLRPLPNGLTGTITLRQLMERAYQVQPFQISGGPDWINSERYTIDARAAGPAGHDQVSLMLQSLLEDRFQLKIHRESHDVPLFDLVLAKGGSKLPPPREGSCRDADPQPEPDGGRMAPPSRGGPRLSRCGGLDVMLESQGARMSGGKVPMREFVRILSGVLGRKVIDRTGLTGPFDITLDFVPDETTPLLPAPPPGAAPSDVLSPPILNALPEQLGLRLEAAKGPVEILVIDRVERPSAN